MIKKVIVLLCILLIIKASIQMCNNIDVSYNHVVNDINKNNDYNYTIGPLPYSNKKFYNNEIDRFYKFIDILNKMKTFEYTNNNRFQQNKMSIKIAFFKKNNKLDYNLLEDFISYANNYNIMVGFAAMRNEDRKEELETYVKLLRSGYRNIFLTLATYHTDIDKKVDYVLKEGGTIRLVKGWYNDGTVKKWDDVTENYYRNAKKLVESGEYHMLATHDFNILHKLYDIYGDQMDKIEIKFFSFSKKFVEKKQKTFPYKIKNKSFYKPYGKVCLSLFYTLRNMNIKRDFQRRYMSKIK
jgi:hypothetical protein